VAAVVQEDFQQRGIATFLLRHLSKVAAQQGIVGFSADILPENHAMQKTFRKLAAPIEMESKDGVMSVRFQLKDVKKRDPA